MIIVTDDNTVTLSAAAARRIAAILPQDKAAEQFVRLEILGGGCSGFQYKFGFDHKFDADQDAVITQDGSRLVIDKTSLSLLRGSVVDYGETLMESGFIVRNPNATASCGCGSSFAVTK